MSGRSYDGGNTENCLEGELARELNDKSELAGWRERGSPRRGGRESSGHCSRSDQLAWETEASFPRNLGFFCPKGAGKYGQIPSRRFQRKNRRVLLEC